MLCLERLVAVPYDEVKLHGELCVPASPRGIAIVASDRPRDTHSSFAAGLCQHGFATLSLDLRTAPASSLRARAIPLARQLHAAREWVRNFAGFAALPIVYVGFGGAASASILEAAAHPAGVVAVAAEWECVGSVGLALARLEAPLLYLADELVRDSSQAAAWLSAKLSTRTRWHAPAVQLR